MLRNGIVLPGLLLRQPNDGNALNEIIKDLKETFIILERLQRFYGERRNYTEIRNALKTTLMILDSGYFTDENLEAAYKPQY